MAVLEDPGHDAERRPQADHVEEQRTQWLHDTAGEQEEQEEGGEGDQGDGERELAGDGVLGVDQCGVDSADQGCAPAGGATALTSLTRLWASPTSVGGCSPR